MNYLNRHKNKFKDTQRVVYEKQNGYFTCQRNNEIQS